MTTETVVAYTPNGREIRQTEAGTYVVQPHNDNYWIECRSAAEALYRYHFPDGDPSARRIAELIVRGWGSQWSIDETACIGVAEADQETAAEMASGDDSLAAAIVAEIEAICRERAST